MFRFEERVGAPYRHNYAGLCEELNRCSVDKDVKRAIDIIRNFCLVDLFFLIYFILGIHKVNHPWLVERINEVQDNRNRTLDLWARGHFKTSVITIAGSIQDILLDRETRIALFSHTKSIAESIVRRIRKILENNQLLKIAFNDILWEKPGDKWSDDGIVVKRDGEYQECTLEPWGLVDSNSTSKHFSRVIYNDIVTRDGVSTPFQREKLLECFGLSHNLREVGGSVCIEGTRYHHGDLYKDLITSGDWTVREHPGTVNGDFPAKPLNARDDVVQLGNDSGVLLDEQEIWQSFKDMGRESFAAQILLSPAKASTKNFDLEWITYFEKRPFTRNYIFVDPANSKKQYADYTVMFVIGIDSRGYYYLLDGVRDRLDIKERSRLLFELVGKWRVMSVFYEQYGMQTDIDYIKEKQREDGVVFKIEPVGGRMSKTDRIMLLQPLFQEHKILFPERIYYKDVNGKRHNIVEEFLLEEYLDYPASQHDDMLDCMARIKDDKVKIYKPAYSEPLVPMGNDWIFKDKNSEDINSWMAV